MPNVNINRKIVLSGTSLLPETKSWLSVLPNRPSALVINSVNTFIKSSKADGNWILLDRFWLFAQDKQANAVYSIANPTSTAMTEVNSPTWTSLQGYTGDGVSMYLNTNYNPSTQGVNFTLNNFSMGVYQRTNVQETLIDMGALSGSNRCYFYSRRTTNSWVSTGNTALDNSASPASVTDSRGLFSLSRVISTTYQHYKNGTNLLTTTTTTSGVPNLSMIIMALNNAGTASLFTTKQYSIAYFGSGSIDNVKFYNAVQTLATTLGFNV